MIYRYLTFEILKTVSILVGLWVFIMFSNRFSEILNKVISGEIPLSLFWQLIGYKLPNILNLVLPISVYLGTLLTLSRHYVSSEMTAMFACGVSHRQVTLAVLVPAFIFAILSAYCSLYLEPNLSYQEQNVLTKKKLSAGLASLVPGKFQTFPQVGRTIYVSEKGEDEQLHNVVVIYAPESKENIPIKVVTAKHGKQKRTGDDAFLLELSDGERIDGYLDQAAMNLTKFEKYVLKLEENRPVAVKKRLKTLPSEELWKSDDPKAQALLQWRLVPPIAILILAWLAVPLSYVAPRQGQYGKIVPALIFFMIYYNILLIAKDAVEKEVLPTWMGLWTIHIGVLILIAILYYRWPKPIWSRS